MRESAGTNGKQIIRQRYRCNASQKANASRPMEINPAGRDIDVNFLQPQNVKGAISTNPSGREIFSNVSHNQNAPSPSEFKFFGNSTLRNASHDKMPFLQETIPSGSAIETNVWQLETLPHQFPVLDGRPRSQERPRFPLCPYICRCGHRRLPVVYIQNTFHPLAASHQFPLV